MTCSSVSPVTYSITMKKVLSCFSAVSTVTMFGWLIEARSRGSFTISLKSRFCLWGTLRATFLLIQVSSARYTEPKPPLPRGERIRYFPMVCPRKNTARLYRCDPSDGGSVRGSDPRRCDLPSLVGARSLTLTLVGTFSGRRGGPL